MRDMITVEPGNIKKEYTLYEGVFNIYATFIKWKDFRKVEEVEFRIYPINNYKIRNVHFCAKRDQLEIIIISDEANNPYIAKFPDFYINEGKKEDVVTLRFYEGETYEEKLCFSMDDSQPERKKGNIIVGG